MKKYTLIFLLFVSSFGFGQELMNFYLEPDSYTGNISLRTTFFHYSGGGLDNMTYTINENVIDVTLCYGVGSTTVITYDEQIFGLEIPTNGTYKLNIKLLANPDGISCNPAVIYGSGTKVFDFPYHPTETIEIPDDNFESFLEQFRLGDDIPDNNLVYKHRIENLVRLNLDYYTLNTMGLNAITSLTGVKEFEALEILYCQYNFINEIDVSYNSNLKWLICHGNLYPFLDLSHNSKLRRLNCGNLNLEGIEVSNSPLLYELAFSGNISEIDLTHNINLQRLEFSQTQLTTLDLTQNTLLNYFRCNFNSQLNSIQFGNSPELAQLHIGDNALNDLDVSNLVNLKEINALNNQLTDLDVSNNAQLEIVFLLSNNLSSLNVKNGNNENLNFLMTINNPDLFCIEVDDEIAAYTYGWQVDSQTEFSEDCNPPDPLTSSIASKNLDVHDVVLFPNPVRDALYVKANTVVSGKLFVYSLQGTLVKSEMFDGNTQVDVSHLPSGIYFLKIQTKGQSITLKFIKE